MATKQRLAVLGGDARQIAMAKRLGESGYQAFVWGLGDCCGAVGTAIVCDSWEDAASEADTVLLPLPASVDGVRVNCPLGGADTSLRLSALFERMQGKTLYGGRFTEALYELAEKHGVTLVDYFRSESLQQRNAVPTAEGAIAIAMQELPITMDGLVCAVIGYGRIGKLLASKLKALGARVTVYARRCEVLAEAEVNGHTVVLFDKKDNYTALKSLPDACRAVFNTVPTWLFTRGVLETVPKNCVLIDLASAPGGIDIGAAHELGLRTVWGTALPGKCTPESAGVILAQTVMELLEIRSV
ncbi:MAG: dipicolinate synthase [Clostridia bacterium]|nr:dipicolinate synthase [Clostridia bacterium]